MPANFDLPALPGALPPPLTHDERHARDELELVSLRATVAKLLEQIAHGPGPAPVALPRVAAPVRAAPQPHSEFIAMLAHELRNPMQPIAMASQMLAKIGSRLPEVARVHAVLDRQIIHMSRLLDDLLEGGRAAGGKIALVLEQFALADVIDAAFETSRPGFEQRHQNLRLCLPPERIVLTGDAIRLAQAFANLLINASQFTHPFGNVVVTARAFADRVEVTFADDGPGIPDDLQLTLFDLFTQGHRTLERAPSGLGLGLFLVRTIVDLHGGAVTATSGGVNNGSTFTVTLPVAAQPPRPAVDPAPSATPERKILIIEDDVDANELMAMLLEMGGHAVTSRFDGESGLSAALASDFDIVLCDLGLPGLNGFEVIAGIKGTRTGRTPLVVATTGYSDPAQLDLARAAGFDRYLVKPLDLDTLLSVIAAAPAQALTAPAATPR